MEILRDTLGREKEDAAVGGGEDTQRVGGMAGVGCPEARRAEIKLQRPAQSHQSRPGTQSWGLSLQGHHSTGQFPAGGLDGKPIIEHAVNRFASSSLSWNFLVFPSFPRFMMRLLPCSGVW